MLHFAMIKQHLNQTANSLVTCMTSKSQWYHLLFKLCKTLNYNLWLPAYLKFAFSKIATSVIKIAPLKISCQMSLIYHDIYVFQKPYVHIIPSIQISNTICGNYKVAPSEVTLIETDFPHEFSVIGIVTLVQNMVQLK